jgi:hypothetical protein
MLAAQAHPDPMSRMSLLARSLKVCGQHLVDVFLDRPQPRRFTRRLAIKRDTE